MIVETDFLDHWKVRLLVRELGTETAPLHVIRLWAHCQQRKAWVFTDWTPNVLASVCRWEGDAKKFWDAMTKTFVDSVEGGIEVHGWAETNARLIANWVNGPKGGRPPNNPTETHGLSQEKPNGNPSKTIGVTDRLDRVDKINETLERLRLRVGKMMGRRESTAWSEKELKQLRVVLKANTPEEDLVVLEAYYASGFKYLRQDIPTLLNNWNGEIDRAKKHSGAAESKFPETHEPWKKSQPVDYDKMTPEERVQFAIG